MSSALVFCFGLALTPPVAMAGSSEKSASSAAAQGSRMAAAARKPPLPAIYREQVKSEPAKAEPFKAEPAKSLAPGAADGSGALLQMGLYASRSDAEWAWIALERKQPAVTDKLVKLIEPGPNGAGAALRARTKDGATDGDALCREASKTGQSCFVVRAEPARPAPEQAVAAAVAPLAQPESKPVVTAAPPAPPVGATATVTVINPAPAGNVPGAVNPPPAVALPAAPPVVAALPAAPPTAPMSDSGGLAARTLDGFIRYSTDDAKVLAEIERRTRRRGRIGAVLPGGGLEVTPAILTQPEFNICALTFDDGPHRTVTRRILDTLNQLKVVSTYFPVGNVAIRNPEIIRDFVATGHEIGNHSYTHNDLRAMKGDALRFEVTETNKLLRSLGATSTLFRPPYGRYNQELLQIVKEENSQAVLWNVDTRDWKVRDPDKIVEHVTTAAGSGSVLLLHSTYPSTADALPRVISALREKNCEFVTLSDWIARMQVAGELPVTNVALPAPVVASRVR